jgi:hypothetical protein
MQCRNRQKSQRNSSLTSPTTHILDNEASSAFKAEIKKNCTIQLVPPDNHRQNLAERAIQTFKSHFKSKFAGVDDNFLMHLWDCLLPQAILTLNLLRQSNVAPAVSAYQYVHGAFDYNKMPLGPKGCAVELHERSERRGSWAMNAVDGWYLCTSDEHYRCHVIYVKHSRSKRISDTLHFKHKHITIPTVTLEDTIVKCLNDLTQALKEQRNTKGAVEYEALQKLDELLNKIPVTPTTEETTRRVTFDPTTKPPAKQQSNPSLQSAVPTPRVLIVTPTPRVQNATPAPRVQLETAKPRVQNTPTVIAKATINKPIPAKARQEPTATQAKLRNKIKEARDIRSRLALRTHMELSQLM